MTSFIGIHYLIVFKKNENNKWSNFSLTVSDINGPKITDWIVNEVECDKLVNALKKVLLENNITLKKRKSSNIFEMSKESISLIANLSHARKSNDDELNTTIGVIKEESAKFEEYSIDEIFSTLDEWNNFIIKIKNFKNLNPTVIKSFRDFHQD
jgi:hypothetical protein